MRLIDADRLVDICKQIISNDWNKRTSPVCWSDAYESFVDEIEEAPTIYAVEVVHGEWIPVDIGDGNPGVNLECSNCGRWVKQKEMFCPRCGATMDGERKEDKHGQDD